MAGLLLQSPRSLSKSAYPTINWRDPINKGLVVANHVDNTEGRDLVSGTSFKWYTNSVGSPPLSQPARIGPAVACLHDYGYWGGGTSYNPISATDDVTVLMWAREDAVTNRGFFRRGRDGSGNGWSLQLKTENSACNPSFGVVWTSPSLVGRTVTNSAASINAGTGSDGMWLLGRYLQGRSLSIFCGNGTVAHDTSSVGSSMRTSTQGIALTGNVTATADNGNFVHFYGTVGNDQFIWARGLSDDECWDILADPMRVYRRPPTLFFFDPAAAGGGATTGVGSATGTSAADALSGSVASAAGSSVAAAVSGSVAVAGGVGTAAAVSGAIGSATGASTASARAGSVGQATGAGVATATSGAIAAAVGTGTATATAGSIAQAAGTSTAAAYSSAASVASASGTSTATALSGSIGQSAGTSTAAGYSSAASIAQAAGTSAGLAIAGFIATSTAASTAIALSGAIGVAAGTSVANGVGLSGNAGVGNAAGTSTANARSGSIGAAAGIATVNGVGIVYSLSIDDRYLVAARGRKFTAKARGRRFTVGA